MPRRMRWREVAEVATKRVEACAEEAKRKIQEDVSHEHTPENIREFCTEIQETLAAVTEQHEALLLWRAARY